LLKIFPARKQHDRATKKHLSEFYKKRGLFFAVLTGIFMIYLGKKFVIWRKKHGEKRGKIIGVLAMFDLGRFFNKRIAWLDGIFIDRRERGQGLGKRTLAKLHSLISRRGFSHLLLWSRDNVKTFYYKVGFKNLFANFFWKRIKKYQNRKKLKG